jgi:Ca2+-binding RTX toxin-like protein
LLTDHLTSAAGLAAVAHLPASDPLGTPDQQDWWVSSAQLRVLDPADAPDANAIDGAIGFSKAWTSDWLGAALHEITHALGRIGGESGNPAFEFDLFRYDSTSSSPQLQLAGGQPAYFSINGGATRLADFGVSSDYADFKNDALTPHDPFDEFTSGDAWTSLDSTVMDALGFNVTSSAPPPPSTTPPDLVAKTFAFDGVTASWNISDSSSGAALPTTTGVYLSADKTITTSDTLLGTVTTPGLTAGGSDSENLAISLPNDLTPGVYYLGALANQTGDVNESKTTNDASNLVPILVGGAGADTLKGTSTVHDLFGFGGDDTLVAGSGSNLLDGGTGNNRAVLSGAFSSYNISQSGDAYLLKGASGTDTLYNIQIVQFSDRQMVLGSTSETLTARASKDTLVGGLGDDTLIANPGKDVLTGGGGNDHFVFGAIADLKVSAPDTITDFISGQDQIDISALNALLPGGEPFHLGATPGHVGDITVSYDAAHGRTVIDIFTNADAKPDGVIWLTGQHTLTGSDFVL